jgi:transposase
VVLSQFGVERKHKEWTPPSPVFKQIRELTRFYSQLREQRTALKNIKHSKEEAFEVSKLIINSNNKLIKSFERQMETCLLHLQKIVDSDLQLKSKIEKVCTIKGIKLLSAATILAETNGFEGFENRKQVASYAGYDVVHNESGTSIKGKTRISKKGNRYIRQALYMPAMTACRYNPEFRRLYLRIIKKKPSKMIGQVAIQRKLLVLIYTLWKTNAEYMSGYHETKVAQQKSQATQDSIFEDTSLIK